MSSEEVLFSVVLPTSIDRGLILPHSIGSVQKQSLQNFEILIVGDGVNDMTRSVISDLAEKDKRIRFFDFPKHPRRGEEYRHQVLMEEAKGRYVAYLCDRDLFLPHHLETLALYLEQYDFASTLNYFIVEGTESMVYGRKNLDSWDAPSWLLSCEGHSLAYYKTLPFGWRTTPKGVYTDRYMWDQFLTQPDCKAYCGLEPTILWFKRGDHPGMSTEERKKELMRWEEIMEDKVLFQLKKEEALHEMMSGFNFLNRNHPLLIKGRKPSQVPAEILKKIKKALSLS
ncbi:glycosyltransferase family 2 protein [Algoriphagus sediminis]|uniref:Glycosyltransferase family A protein n=1 Tax=Algoriphagus sediminis TaxID=3057113 RepID=A0ABT7YEU9_9BACT|nr:glycosyltransferase family A protein [Algoriphagus sediminis]MDN3205056.1 glycosyltransferase family A protein [Algoriphagus sediminis]